MQTKDLFGVTFQQNLHYSDGLQHVKVFSLYGFELHSLRGTKMNVRFVEIRVHMKKMTTMTKWTTTLTVDAIRQPR